MKVPDDDTSRMLEEECPGSPDLESALANESVGNAASHPAVVVDASTPLSGVLQLMREGNRGAVLVLRNGMLVGIFTERDVLMKVAGQPTDIEHTPVSHLMTTDPVTLPADASVAFALNKMLIEGFRHIPLVDDQNQPTAVVSMRDLIDYLSNFFSREILNLPPDPRVAFRNRDGA
jgi:2-oxoglutarate/2-oxoacid ferredoxin oxidoreductase subunit beta